jgi:PAS domain S-box-containing protein
MIAMQQVKHTILIVKESPVEREVYRSYLHQETNFTYDFWEAESTEVALRLCGSQLPDCIVLDYLLPDRNGLDLLTELKTYMGKNCPPVIMLNDRGNEAIAIQAFKTGVEDYLIESEITAESFRYVMRTAIENFRLRQTLRESEERYRAIVEDQTELICRFLPDCTLTFVNAAYSRYFDSTPTELIGQNFLNLIPENDRSCVRRQIAEFSAVTPENAVITHEHPVIKPNGEIGWQQWTNRAIFNINGELREFQAVGRDISEQQAALRERKQIEISLQKANERFEIAGTVNCLIYDYDLQKNTVERSQGLTKIFGYLPSEIEPTAEWWYERIHPNQREKIQEAKRATELGTYTFFCLEYQVRHRDGYYVWVQDRACIVRDESSRALRIVGSTIDISERKQTEQRLLESEQRLRLGVQVAGVALARFNYGTNSVELSPEAAVLYGFSPNESIVTRDRVHATFHPEERELMEGIIQQVIDPNGNGWFEREHRVVWSSGEVRWLYVRKQTFFDRSGTVPRPDYAILAAIDITDRKQIESERDRLLAEVQAARTEAEVVNRDKDEFVAVIAHELRSPINSVAGWVQLLRTRQFDRDTINRAYEAIERGTQTQVQLIEDLLDISRIACGTLRLTFAPVNLTGVIEAALNLVRPMVDSKQIHLEIQLTERIQVSGDANRLQQIVVNLLTNAIKFTPSGGIVTIVLEIVEKQARIKVKDTGQGISPEFLPNIFERFQQAQKSSGSKGGLGLGLAIVKNLVEMHSGTITADSLGIGEGATFTVCLPLIESEIVTNTQEISIASDSFPLAGIRILAVDDEPDSLELLQFILENAGAEVQTAKSGSVALEVLNQFNPNFLVSDISMPDLNGHELLQQIRTIYSERQIIAIALTAYASSSDRDYALRMGFEKYFSKPIEPEVLVKAIVSLLV